MLQMYIKCHQMSERHIFHRKYVMENKDVACGEGEESNASTKGCLCRAEGAEVPVFS